MIYLFFKKVFKLFIKKYLIYTMYTSKSEVSIILVHSIKINKYYYKVIK